MPNVPNSSIQEQALHWLVENYGGLAPIEGYDCLERFVLAIVYLSMDGNGWSKEGNDFDGLEGSVDVGFEGFEVEQEEGGQ